MDWSSTFYYAFVPFAVILKCIRRLLLMNKRSSRVFVQVVPIINYCTFRYFICRAPPEVMSLPYDLSRKTHCTMCFRGLDGSFISTIIKFNVSKTIVLGQFNGLLMKHFKQSSLCFASSIRVWCMRKWLYSKVHIDSSPEYRNILILGIHNSY